MLLTNSFLSALAGVGIAGAAALMSDTGIDGKPGAFLAFAAAVVVIILLVLGPVDVHFNRMTIAAREMRAV